MHFLDAPISGGPQKARDGTLTIMCGGTKEAYNKAEPIMQTMGSHVRLMGGHGVGTAVKLVSTPVNTILQACKIYTPIVHCSGLTQLLGITFDPPINMM